MSRPTVARPSGGVTGYLPAMSFAALLGAGAWYTLQPSVEVAPGRVALGPMSHRNAAEAVSFNGIAAGARAAAAELTRRTQSGTVLVSASAASGMAPLPGVTVAGPDPSNQTPAVRLTGIESAQPSDREKAKADAVAQAREKLADLFAALRGGAVELPDADEFERQFVPPESVVERRPTEAEKTAWRAEKLDENRVWMSVSVSVTEEQLRHLRARHRLNELSRWAAVALLVLAVGYGVLRLVGGRKPPTVSGP